MMGHKNEVSACPEEFEIIPTSSGDANICEKPNCKECLSLSFGNVEVGEKNCCKITLYNKYDSENVFSVTQDQKTNPLYQVFNIGSHKYKISPFNQADVKFYYKPLFPNTRSTEGFTIIDNFDNVIKVKVIGCSVGPEVQVSTPRLRFQSWPERKNCKRILEFKNISEYEATFSFDCDSENSIFVVDPLFGVIPGRKYVYINVTFQANNFGNYGYDLTCLLQNHVPIIIKLIGIYSPKSSQLIKDIRLSRLSSSITQNNSNFQKYMEDIQEKLKEVPVFSLSEHFLDFMGVQISLGNEKCKTLVTSMTNNSRNTIHVKWSDGEIFKIQPNKVSIPKNESVLFECVFSPDKPDFLYSKIAIGNVSSSEDENCEGAEVPLNATLRFLGHSFYGNTFWLPQLDVPEVVILPPSIPGESSYQTFPITTRGHLPVSFHFIPPKNSNFLIKPMVGLVKGTKLICAQLCSEVETKTYVEKWDVRLNGQSNNCRYYFYLKGYSENINVTVGNDNKIRIGSIQKGCIKKILVPITNTSVHNVHYEFPLEEGIHDFLDINNPSGDLAPHESRNLQVVLFNGSNYLGEKNYTITYRIFLLRQNVITDKPIEKVAEIFTESSYSELCCTPNFHDFGFIEYRTKHVVYFRLCNFGDTSLYYKLFCLDDDGKLATEIRISPEIGVLNPRTAIDTVIYYNARQIGKRVMNIFYTIRRAKLSLEVLNNYKIHIFTMKTNCVQPYLQITDILFHNYGRNFTKMQLWEMLDLDEWNKALREASGKNEHVELKFPDHEKTDRGFKVVLLLKNQSKFPVNFDLKRKQGCECKLVEMRESISIRKYHYTCPHREICKLYFTDSETPGDSIQALEMEISYNLLGLNCVWFCLKFSSLQRCIILSCRVNTLSPTIKTISMYKLHALMQFSPICLSEFEPMTECFWLYNNSSNAVNYSLDTNLLKEFNFESEFKAFEFWFCEGLINSFSTGFVLIKYTPIEEKRFELNLPIYLGDNLNLIRVNVLGTKYFNGFIQRQTYLSPHTNIDQAIVLSEHHLDIKPFPVWSTTTRMIFIRNLHKDIIGYSWQRSIIEGFVDVNVDHRKGVLLPGESHAIIIKIRSFKTPCKISVNFSCKLLNHTQYYLHKKTLANFNARQEEIEQELAIYDNESYNPPVNDLKVVPFPSLFHISVSLDIQITSIADRDLHYTPEEQFSHSPQYHLRFENEDYSLKVIEPIIDPLENPIEIDNYRKESFDTKNETGDITPIFDEEKDDIQFYKHVMECLIADTVFSSTFRSVLDMQHQLPPLHYSQITTNQEDKPSRRDLINDLYNDPPPPIVAAVLKEIIADSIHEIFKLGAQTKNRPRCDYLEHLKNHANKYNCSQECACYLHT